MSSHREIAPGSSGILDASLPSRPCCPFSPAAGAAADVDSARKAMAMPKIELLAVLLPTLVLARGAHAQFGPRVVTTVNPDHTVTVQLEAPETSSAQVRIANGFRGVEVTSLARDAGGVWTATLGPFAPDLYQYDLLVDGLQIADPGNGSPKPERAVRTSLLIVPGNSLVDDLDVPHGTLHEETLNSRVARGPRPLLVYTPPGYESTSDLPVLVIYHGANDTIWSWVRQGRIVQSFDNAIARGTVMPMVVVVAGTYPAQLADRELLARSNQIRVDAELLTEILPFVERRYRVRAEGRCRALAGLSMGGGQALYSALTHPSIFSAVSLLSPAYLGELPGVDARQAGAFDRFEIVTGSADVILHMQQAIDQKLSKAGVPHTYRKVPGGDHSMFVWRPALRSFAEALTHDHAAGRWCPHPDATSR